MSHLRFECAIKQVRRGSAYIGKHFLWPSTFLLILGMNFISQAWATAPGDLPDCGGYGQRACCLLEAFPSCEPNLAETGAVADATICGGFPAGTCGFAQPGDLDFCGGDGQRACCFGETFLAQSCDPGAVENFLVPGGQCAAPAYAPGATANTCVIPTPCGGEGERGCSIFDSPNSNGKSCDDGLIEIGGCDDPLSCGGSSGFCYKPTDCGGDGERACCGIPGVIGDSGGTALACESGLTFVLGVAGDAGCGIGNLLGNPLAALGSCINLATIGNPIDEPGLGWHDTDTSDCGLRGYADLHTHMFAHLAHGGGALAGTPWELEEDGGVNKALRPDYGVWRADLDLVSKTGEELPRPIECNELLHPGECGDTIFHGPHLISHDAVGVGTHEGAPLCGGLLCGAGSNYGSPLFSGWPTWRSTTHQQMYYRWLERAWRGGLRLIVQFAVTNEAMCLGSKQRRDTDCADDMAAVDEQIQATYDFQDFIDEKSGGVGKGWFRIVKTPAEAAEVLAEGKLAVVLGIEVANLFNCKKDGCRDSDKLVVDEDTGELESDELYVNRMVDKYYDELGVRVIFPIHNFDNAFGAPATWQNAINAGNRVSEGEWWDAEECPSTGTGEYGFKLGDIAGWIVAFLGFGVNEAPELNAGSNSCNVNGLTPLGEKLITYMMGKGIIVDVDHMSNYALETTLDIAENIVPPRPVIASHVQFFELNEQQIRHERQRTLEALERIRDGGGMIAAMLKDDVQDTDNTGGKFNIPYTWSPTGHVIEDDCRHSSRTWAQMYQYSVDAMQGPVAMGSDFNGVAGHVGPRFGYDACGQDSVERSRQARAKTQLQYPFKLPGFGTFDHQVTGKRTFDFNNDGLAHIGLLPDMVADLYKIGLSEAELDPLFRSAAAFVDVWRRADGEVVPVVPTGALGCQSVEVDADENCQANVTVANSATQLLFGDSLVQSPPPPYALGKTKVALSTDQSNSCDTPPAGCSGTVKVVDKTPPSIICPEDPVEECAGSKTFVTFDDPVVEADNCGLSTFQGCSSVSGDLYAFGDKSVSCTAFDSASNVNNCSFTIKVVDKTPPDVTCPADIVAECSGNHSATVTPGVASATDICAGVNQSTHPTASFTLGATPLEYVATDDVGLKSSCNSLVTVEDTTPPTITGIAATPNVLSPPNHKFVKVSLQVESSDICDVNTPVCEITAISSSEPVNGPDDGNTKPDWKITGPFTANLRAERSGVTAGRVYSLEITCSDEAGNTTKGTTTVSVPL